MPKVSVIIPTYNSAKYITTTVESVLAQTFTDYELIVVDDGSTDETKEVLQQFDDKLTYIFQENQERSAARNNGIRTSSGQYIAFLDADDIWLPDKLERQVALLDQHPKVALVFCQALYIDSSGNRVHLRGRQNDYENYKSDIQPIIKDWSRDLILGSIVRNGGSSAVVRRNMLDKAGLFDTTLNYGEDWHLWIRLSHQGPFAYIPEPLIYYRIFGWHKVLAQEASEQKVAQLLKVIGKALDVWDGDNDKANQLYARGVADIHTRAALANFQLGRGLKGRSQLEKAISANPEQFDKEYLIHLAVDRAKEIQTETNSYQAAEKFIHIFFSNLPPNIEVGKNDSKKALGWLYIGGAFEKHRAGDKVTARRLLIRGIICTPTAVKNRGIVSFVLQLFLNKGLANFFRQAGKKIFHSPSAVVQNTSD